jgi:hypothetical protein
MTAKWRLATFARLPGRGVRGYVRVAGDLGCGSDYAVESVFRYRFPLKYSDSACPV